MHLSLRENPNSFQAMFVTENPLALASKLPFTTGLNQTVLVSNPKMGEMSGDLCFMKPFHSWFGCLISGASTFYSQPSSISQLHHINSRFMWLYHGFLRSSCSLALIPSSWLPMKSWDFPFKSSRFWTLEFPIYPCGIIGGYPVNNK